MSKASNRNKQRKMRQSARIPKAKPFVKQQSRRANRQTQTVLREIYRRETPAPRIVQPRKTPRIKQRRPTLRSQMPSRRQKRVARTTAQLRSVQHAFKTIGANVKITKGNYQKYFRILEDAKITAGQKRYGDLLRYASNTVNLDDYHGRLFDLVFNRVTGVNTVLW